MHRKGTRHFSDAAGLGDVIADVFGDLGVSIRTLTGAFAARKSATCLSKL